MLLTPATRTLLAGSRPVLEVLLPVRRLALMLIPALDLQWSLWTLSWRAVSVLVLLAEAARRLPAAGVLQPLLLLPLLVLLLLLMLLLVLLAVLPLFCCRCRSCCWCC